MSSLVPIRLAFAALHTRSTRPGAGTPCGARRSPRATWKRNPAGMLRGSVGCRRPRWSGGGASFRGAGLSRESGTQRRNLPADAGAARLAASERATRAAVRRGRRDYRGAARGGRGRSAGRMPAAGDQQQVPGPQRGRGLQLAAHGDASPDQEAARPGAPPARSARRHRRRPQPPRSGALERRRRRGSARTGTRAGARRAGAHCGRASASAGSRPCTAAAWPAGRSRRTSAPASAGSNT
jgi:hypothetical protein